MLGHGERMSEGGCKQMTETNVSAIRRRHEEMRRWIEATDTTKYLNLDDTQCHADRAALLDLLAAKESELATMQAWVNDLQKGMYINCVYCGHRYGPDDKVKATMAEVLKAHIEECPKHPMSALKAELATARGRVERLEEAIEPFASFARRIDALKPAKGVPPKPADDRIVHVSVGMDFATDYTFDTFRRCAALAKELGNG
jgi:hypothetical protein